MPTTAPPIERQRAFWNWHWKHWRERRTINEWKNARHNEVLACLRSLSLERPRILDIGCGPGWYTEGFAALGEVTGIDLSEEAIAMARSRFPSVTFLVGNVYDCPLPISHFDAVVSQEVVDHVPDPAGFLRRAADVLRPGGYLVLSCANKFVMDRLGANELPAQPQDHVGLYMSARTLRRLLRAADFQVLRIWSILPVAGSRGVLRLTNSARLTGIVSRLVRPEAVTRLKERLGFGYTLITLARRREPRVSPASSSL